MPLWVRIVQELYMRTACLVEQQVEFHRRVDLSEEIATPSSAIHLGPLAPRGSG